MTDPSFLLLTGTLCDERLWSDLPFKESRARTVRVPGSRPGIATCKEEAERLLAEVSVPVDLVGFSLGGIVALEMTAQRPDLVASLTLVCTGAGVDAPEVRQRRLDQLEIARRRGLADLVRSELWPLYDANGMPDLLPKLVAMAEQCGVETFERQTAIALTRADSRPRLGDISVPTTLVSGGRDRLCPPSRHLEMARLFRHGTTVCFENSGHLVPMEDGVRLVELLHTCAHTPSFA